MLQECYFDRQSGVQNTENHQKRIKLNIHEYEDNSNFRSQNVYLI
jgi:hypothetical protein